MIAAEKRSEFVNLYREFIPNYASQPIGQDHLRSYDTTRLQGQRNFQAIKNEVDRGNLPTEQVLRTLLPHTNSKAHRDSGAWIHLAPVIQGDIRSWFEAAGWTQAGDWPKIARAVWEFVCRCSAAPSDLVLACRQFLELPYTTGFQTGMLTPILNALRPEDFALVNNKSRSVVNYFAGESFKQRLTDYPATNAALLGLVHDLERELREPTGADARPADLLDMFCHWLVAVKKWAPVSRRGQRVRTSGGEIAVSVADDTARIEEQGATTESQTRESHKIQAILAEIGIKMGFQIWIPRSDRTKVVEQSSLLRNALLDELPLNYIDATLKTIEQIDVIWIRRHSIARAFEVEHTTAVYSGLLRMADLLALQPDINIRLHIVAPDNRHDKVLYEVKRPIFSSLEKGPLYRRCSFLSYSNIKELRNLDRLEHMTDSVLNTYEEYAEED